MKLHAGSWRNRFLATQESCYFRNEIFSKEVGINNAYLCSYFKRNTFVALFTTGPDYINQKKCRDLV